MGLLRLINAARLAPLEELLADLGGNAPAAGARAGASRSTSSASIAGPSRTAAAPPPYAASAPPASPSAAKDAPLTASTSPQPMQSSAPGPSVSHAAVQEIADAQGLTPNLQGLSEEQLAQIKSAIQAQQKFLAELVEHGSRWELDGAELRIYFSHDKRAFAEMLESRNTLEKVRIASSNVLGRAVRVCAKLEAVAAAAASASRTGPATQ